MKKVLLTAVAVFAFSFANAQDSTTGGFSKGNIMLSGGIGIGSESQDVQKSSGFSVTPKVGYFLTNNFVVGLALGFESTKDENGAANPIVKNTTTSLGVFGRYYFTPASQFSFFGELGVNSMSTKEKTTNPSPIPSSEVKFNGFDVVLAPGVSYFLSKSFALETSIGVLGYQTEKQKDLPGAKSKNSFNFGVNLSDIKLGLVYKF